MIGISQSGETRDTLSALKLARDAGARVLAVTNTPDSQIAREADAVLLTRAGLEVSVAASKTFTAQLALLSLLAVRLGEVRGVLDPGARGGAARPRSTRCRRRSAASSRTTIRSTRSPPATSSGSSSSSSGATRASRWRWRERSS